MREKISLEEFHEIFSTFSDNRIAKKLDFYHRIRTTAKGESILITYFDIESVRTVPDQGKTRSGMFKILNEMDHLAAILSLAGLLDDSQFKPANNNNDQSRDT